MLNIETISQYNDMLGVETLNPLVSVIDLSKANPMRHMRHTFSFYVVFLKDEKNCDLIYGRQRYDYQKGSVVCLAPGQVIGIEDTGVDFQPKGWALCFDPELIHGTALSRNMREYSFFSYEVNEALHLSEQERELKTQERGVQLNRQFENRLFDRDTLLLCHYDVNFLYIVSLYGRNNKSARNIWREYVRKEFRSRIQGTLNQLYTFRTIQPLKEMDCYRFIQDNFQRLNGKLYRPKADSNYLVLALMKEEEADMWAALHVKSETIRGEVDKNKELLDSLQTHFYVSKPFMLDTELHVEGVGNVGTLNMLPKPEVKDILTGMVRTTDTDYLDFYSHTAKTYTMERIPTAINVMDLRYFLPMVVL